jgi:omega-6 fatty acid desaturase (delta-12 desaturase)
VTTHDPNALASAETDWRAVMARYQKPKTLRAIRQIASTLALLCVALIVMYQCLDVSIVLTLLLAIPTAGLMVRTFALMHDCSHGSFLPWRSVNDAVGVVTGILTMTPFSFWRREHALHHSSSGDLDRRGVGSINTLTVREYLARNWWGRFRYRLYRNPLVILGLGPLHMIIMQRFSPTDGPMAHRHRASIWATNAAIALLLAGAWILFGPKSVLLVYLPAYYLAAVLGVGLFYVQHQFEDAYWEPHGEWDYKAAALHGSSYLKLPGILRWFTGSIGLHHVHHLGPHVPNYRLQQCHDENPMFHDAPIVTLSSCARLLQLALWDEDRRRLVPFREVRKEVAA